MLLALLTLAAAGCGGDDERDDGTLRGTHLTIYSSMPLEGPDRVAAIDVVRAQRLALQDARLRDGRYELRFVSLDASTPKAEQWDPAQISENARMAAADPTTIAYVGEFHTGSSAVSIPLLNEAGIAQISPMDAAMELTTRTLAVNGSPERYYPNSEEVGRTFARVVPSDRVEARAQVTFMRRVGVERLTVLTDDDPTAMALAEVVAGRAREAGIAVAPPERVEAHAEDQRELVATVLAGAPDAVFYAGGTHVGSVQLWRQLAMADPALKLFAPNELVDGPFLARIGRAGDHTYVTRPLWPLDRYPPAARRFARRFADVYGRPPRPEALYGYAAMQAVLGAIRRAQRTSDGAVTRAAVVRELFRTRRTGGVLGPFAIEPSGDTTLTTYGAYRVRDGRLRFAGEL